MPGSRPQASVGTGALRLTAFFQKPLKWGECETVQKRKLGRRMWSHRFYYLLVLPGLIYFLVFHYGAMYGLILAFKDFSPMDKLAGIFTGKWVGFKHFSRLFGSYYFGNILGNTLKISLLKLLYGFPAPILLALLLNEVRQEKFKKVVQTISYLPHFLSMVVISGLLSMLLSTDGGPINKLLILVGKNPIYFLGDPRYFGGVLVVSHVWQSVGWGSIIYLSAITGIDPQLYEAAMIDGAGRLRQVFHVTLPGIASVVSIMLIMTVGGIMNAGFEQIFSLYSPVVYSVADIIDTFVYREGIRELNYSYATAVGMFKSVVAMILVIATNFISHKLGQEGVW